MMQARLFPICNIIADNHTWHGTLRMLCSDDATWLQVDNWLHQRPFDAPGKAQQSQGPVIVIGAGPAGLAAAHHLKVSLVYSIATTVTSQNASRL